MRPAVEPARDRRDRWGSVPGRPGHGHGPGPGAQPAHRARPSQRHGGDGQTGRRVGGNSAWLWVATNEHLTVYNVADCRGFDQATDLVDEDYTGTIVRDGWAPYRRYEKATHQTCLAHLLRRCGELRGDLPGWAQATPRVVRDILTEALAA